MKPFFILLRLLVMILWDRIAESDKSERVKYQFCKRKMNGHFYWEENNIEMQKMLLKKWVWHDSTSKSAYGLYYRMLGKMNIFWGVPQYTSYKKPVFKNGKEIKQKNWPCSYSNIKKFLR